MGEERIIPPPLAPRRREAAILEETPASIAVALWQEARHLQSWALAPETARAGLFHARPRAKVQRRRRQTLLSAGPLAEALAVFWDLPRNPVDADPGLLAAACRQVVEWALREGYTQTAIEWAETGALCDPQSPAAANLAGRVTRDGGEEERAEVWFRRGIGNARERGSEVELIRGHIGYGRLCQQTGRITAAARHFNSGSRLARKSGQQWLAAEVQHDLMLLLTVTGQYLEAGKHAQLAFRWYGKRHVRFPFFVADLALLLVLQGRYRWAARYARACLEYITAPGAKAVLLALRARALAGAGLPEALPPLRRRVLRELDRHQQEHTALALWHLASAEWIAGEWEGAIRSARLALEAAVARNDRETASATQHLLGKLDARAEPPATAGAQRDDLPPIFLRTVVTRLSAWSPERSERVARRAAWAA